MQHKRLTHSRSKLPKISMSSILLKFKHKVSMTWRHLLTHNVRGDQCKIVDNIHSKVVLRFEFKPWDSRVQCSIKAEAFVAFSAQDLRFKERLYWNHSITQEQVWKTNNKTRKSQRDSSSYQREVCETGLQSQINRPITPLLALGNKLDIPSGAPPYFWQHLLQEFKHDILFHGLP